MSLERATIAERQGASEDQKFIAKLPQSNMNLFFTNGIICIEDLNVRGMIKNSRLSRSIADMSFHEISRQLKYKAARNEQS